MQQPISSKRNSGYHGSDEQAASIMAGLHGAAKSILQTASYTSATAQSKCHKDKHAFLFVTCYITVMNSGEILMQHQAHFIIFHHHLHLLSLGYHLHLLSLDFQNPCDSILCTTQEAVAEPTWGHSTNVSRLVLPDTTVMGPFTSLRF